MRINWLSQYNHHFPPVETATPDGMLAVGGDLHPDRLLAAYRRGIFPWYNDPGPIIWHSPDPRFVLFPEELKIHKSMRSYFNQEKYHITVDQRFRDVITACADVYRRGQNGTWITDDMIDAYTTLHQRGIAHSVEVWTPEGEIAGGLYGIALGKVFFGESMFTTKPNGSKFGFIALIKALRDRYDFKLIDCQQKTKHLASLGARSIPRSEFVTLLNKWCEEAVWVNWLDLGNG